MSGLKNIQLPQSVLANIYKNTALLNDDEKKKPFLSNHIKEPEIIIENVKKGSPEIKSEVPVPSPLPEKWFFGNNAKGFVIIVKDKENVFLAENKLELLGNILTACKMNIGDVAIVNYLQTPINFQDIKTKIAVNYFLSFGINAVELQMPNSIQLYQKQVMNNCSVLFASDFDSMTGTSNEAKIEKSKLWLSLKGMLGI